MTANFRPIFIVGTPRAGTTLVSKILGRHPKVHALGETHFFEDIWANRREFGALETEAEMSAAVNRLMTVFDRFNQEQGQTAVNRVIQPAQLGAQALANGGGYDGLYRAFTEALDENKNRRYCDDTPKHLFYLKTILQFFPHAAIIICVRDPRDFLCSYKNFWRSSRTPERIKDLYHPIMTAVLWRNSVNIALNDPIIQQSDNMMRLRYESLVAEPAHLVKEICAHTGLEYDGRLLEIESHNSSFDQSEASGIFQGSVGKWTDCLTQEEIWWVQKINQKHMQRLGYETADLSISWIKLISLLLSTPLAFFRALQANSGRRGPLLPYLMRRFSLLRK